MNHLCIIYKLFILSSTTATIQNLCLHKSSQHPDQSDLGPEIKQSLPYVRFPALPSLKQVQSHTVPDIKLIKIMLQTCKSVPLQQIYIPYSKLIPQICKSTSLYMLYGFTDLRLNEQICSFRIHASQIYKSNITVIGLFFEPSWVVTNKENCTVFTNLLCSIN